MKISEKAHQAFRAHVLEAYPNEASGILVKGKYIRNEYKVDNPEHHFQIDPVLLVKYQGKIDAILHSHPYKIDDRFRFNPAWPSETDQKYWMQGNIPWGIVATEGENISDYVWMDDSVIPPLLGREFIAGVQDCYAVVRDYYRLQGIELKNMPRDMSWWEPTKDASGNIVPGRNLFADHFEEFGFREITAKEAQIGDVVLIQFRSPVINHSGVITGENEITHHSSTGLSRTEDMSRWTRWIMKYLRYGK